MAQLVARLVRNEKARGSNPLSSTNVLGGPVGAAQNIYRDMRFEEELRDGATVPLSCMDARMRVLTFALPPGHA